MKLFHNGGSCLPPLETVCGRQLSTPVVTALSILTPAVCGLVVGLLTSQTPILAEITTRLFTSLCLFVRRGFWQFYALYLSNLEPVFQLTYLVFSFPLLLKLHQIKSGCLFLFSRENINYVDSTFIGLTVLVEDKFFSLIIVRNSRVKQQRP